MEYLRVTSENIKNEHICCAISNDRDIQAAYHAQSLFGH